MTAQSSSNSIRKNIRATKANPDAPKVDGKLNDPIWATAEFHSDFLQRLPNECAQPGEKTEVAIAYDENTLYVGAGMYCDHPDKLRMHRERRDNQAPAEQFIVSIDLYYDRRTGFGFGVYTGVRFDRYYPEDSEGGADYSFNPVWRGHANVDETGWVAEITIPFSQLRFAAKPQQTWGISFNRWIPERNEDPYWVYTPREEAGFVSRFYDQSEGGPIELDKNEVTGEEYYSVTDGAESFTVPYLDFGARSFRSNIVLRWEFMPGSGISAKTGRSVRLSVRALCSTLLVRKAKILSPSRLRTGFPFHRDRLPNC
ncbi:MAG: carbohydrate binding family 9 domain-containing protein [Candidatus Zixiibacteriota bacterium]